jgi:hypothetical protein
MSQLSASVPAVMPLPNQPVAEQQQQQQQQLAAAGTMMAGEEEIIATATCNCPRAAAAAILR